MKHMNFLGKSLMALTGCFLVSGVSETQAAALLEYEFGDYEYCYNGTFYHVSNNGEYAVGCSLEGGSAFIWTRSTGKIEQITGAAYTDSEVPDYNGIEAYDVSDNGRVVGVAPFEGVYGSSTGNKRYAALPAYWEKGVWKQLPMIEGVELRGGGYDGTAKVISADGKVIGGYLKRPTVKIKDGVERTTNLLVPVKWVYSESLQDYELFYFEGEVFGQGFITGAMSDDGTMVGGRMEYEVGTDSPGIWFTQENKLQRIVSEGTPDDPSLDEYWPGGSVAGISPNGKYAVGYWSLTDYNLDPEFFIWSKEDGYKNLGYGAASAVTDRGTIVGGTPYHPSQIRLAGSDELIAFATYLFDTYGYEGNSCTPIGISEDEEVICGYTIGVSDFGMMMNPAIFDAKAESAVNKVANDIAYKVFADGNRVKITGDVASIHVDVYNMSGAKVYATDQTQFELPSGYYLVTVSGVNGNVTKKLWVK